MTDDLPLFARNLTARAERRVSGNPDISRPEDMIGNCFPGLEMDLRTLDRRFFPGLVFDFLSSPDNTESYLWQGARLTYCDPHNDPDLQGGYPAQLPAGAERDAIVARRATLLATLVDNKMFRLLNEGLVGRLSDKERAQGQGPSKGFWYLETVTATGPKGPKAITMRDKKGSALDGLVVWRLVRSLVPGPIEIELAWRAAPAARGTSNQAPPAPVRLHGWRRRFTDPRTGVLSGAYQPGELTMSMCSPWQHDFRDCACHYWASNRPDIVFGAVDPTQVQLPGGASADPVIATTRLDWMRADRSPEAAAGALSTMNANRPFQLDHYQINTEWQKLSVVLKNTEIGETYTPPPIDHAKPFASPRMLYEELQQNLAGLEMTLALEYLYAYFSIISPADTGLLKYTERFAQWPQLAEDAASARHTLLMIAISEMQHLRWVNELLAALATTFQGEVPGFAPVLIAAERVPLPGCDPDATRPRALRPLTPQVLDDMIAVEKPSGGIDGAYARVIATLLQPNYPLFLHELASRIANDGTQHYSRLESLRISLGPYGAATPYLRDIALAGRQNPAVQKAVAASDAIIQALSSAYQSANPAGPEQGAAVEMGRRAMNELVDHAEAAAREGFGVPFW
jgi:hypothetical protein